MCPNAVSAARLHPLMPMGGARCCLGRHGRAAGLAACPTAGGCAGTLLQKSERVMLLLERLAPAMGLRGHLGIAREAARLGRAEPGLRHGHRADCPWRAPWAASTPSTAVRALETSSWGLGDRQHAASLCSASTGTRQVPAHVAGTPADAHAYLAGPAAAAKPMPRGRVPPIVCRLQACSGRLWRRPELAELAGAIFESVLPRRAGDQLPQSPPGVLAACADRLDSIVGLIAAGCAPSSAADPFGVRRDAYALLQVCAVLAWELGSPAGVACLTAAVAMQGRPGAGLPAGQAGCMSCCTSSRPPCQPLPGRWAHCKPCASHVCTSFRCHEPCDPEGAAACRSWSLGASR